MKSWRGAGDAGVRAERLRIRPWTDPRLLIGLLLVLGAAVLGARLVALGDETVEYWTVGAEVRAGDPLSADHLVPGRARLVDASSAEQYLRVDDDLPGRIADLQWDRDMAEGALIDASALTPRSQAAVRQLPLTVAEGSLPTDLARGDRVEVWVGPGPGDEGDGPSVRALEQVRVLRTGSDAGALGGALARTVLVEVPASALTGQIVSTVATGHVTLVRVS